MCSCPDEPAKQRKSCKSLFNSKTTSSMKKGYLGIGSPFLIERTFNKLNNRAAARR